MFFQQGLQGLPQGEVFLLPWVRLRGEVAYPEPAADAAGQGFGDGLLIFHQPPGIGAVIMEGQFRVDRQHGVLLIS